MARDFNGSTQYLQTDAAVLSGVPLTMACMFISDTVTARQMLMALVNSGDDRHYFELSAAGDVAGDPVQALTRSGEETITSFAKSSSGYTAGTLRHACGVWAATNSRAAYLDGANKGTNSVTSTPSGLNRTNIGRLGRASPLFYMDGKVAEAAIWNVALTDAEVAILALGYSPLFVRPASLVAYWQILGRTDPEIDLVGGYNLTLTAAPAYADHPRVLRPSNQILRVKSAGGAPPAGRRRSWATIIGG